MKTTITAILSILFYVLTGCTTETNTELTEIPMLTKPDHIRIEAEWGKGVHEFAWYTKLVLSPTEQYIQTRGLKEKIALNINQQELLELYQPFVEEDFNSITQPRGKQSTLVGANWILLETKGKEAGKIIESMLSLDMHAYLKPSKEYERFDTLSSLLKEWTASKLKAKKVSYTLRFDPQFLAKAKPFYFRIGDYYDSYENEELMKTGKITVDLLVGTNFYWVEWKKRPYLANKDGWIKIDTQQKELTFKLDGQKELVIE